LKAPPAGTVLSLDEICAIAEALEQDAAARYAELGARARADGQIQLADLFERLAEEERGHEMRVRYWTRQRTGRAPDRARIKWALPEVFDEEEAEELALSRTASTYRVLAMAVRNEERAFAFWSYVAAEAPTPELRAGAETMAKEELRHLSVLRQARRQAYHAGLRRSLPDAARSVEEVWAEASVLERTLSRQLGDLAARLDGNDRKDALELAAEAKAMAERIVGTARESSTSRAPDLATTAEQLVDDYLVAAQEDKNEAKALEAQSLASRAVRRLSWIRARLQKS